MFRQLPRQTGRQWSCAVTVLLLGVAACVTSGRALPREQPTKEWEGLVSATLRAIDWSEVCLSPPGCKTVEVYDRLFSVTLGRVNPSDTGVLARIIARDIPSNGAPVFRLTADRYDEQVPALTRIAIAAWTSFDRDTLLPSVVAEIRSPEQPLGVTVTARARRLNGTWLVSHVVLTGY